MPDENILVIQLYLCECMEEGMKTLIIEKQNIVTRIIVVLCKENEDRYRSCVFNISEHWDA